MKLIEKNKQHNEKYPWARDKTIVISKSDGISVGDVLPWLRENLGDDHHTRFHGPGWEVKTGYQVTLYLFDEERDATMFMLRWS
jgi:hypothetical protein